jgi:hypothetical protein
VADAKAKTPPQAGMIMRAREPIDYGDLVVPAGTLGHVIGQENVHVARKNARPLVQWFGSDMPRETAAELLEWPGDDDADGAASLAGGEKLLAGPLESGGREAASGRPLVRGFFELRVLVEASLFGPAGEKGGRVPTSDELIAQHARALESVESLLERILREEERMGSHGPDSRTGVRLEHVAKVSATWRGKDPR